MAVEEIIAYLSGIVRLSDGFRSALTALMSCEVYRAHQVVDAPGNHRHRMWLVDSGLLRRYYFDQDGKEQTEYFHTERELIFSLEAYWSQRTENYLEVMQDTILYALSYADFQSLRVFPETEHLVMHFLLRQRREELFRQRLLLLSAEERYHRFREVYPAIFRQVSLRLIASYLHMTRENLSRLISRDH